MSDLHTLAEQVHDQASFHVFIQALINDREQDPQHAPTWQNDTIASYLEAAQAWSQDSDQEQGAPNPWQYLARFLYAGKVYE